MFCSVVCTPMGEVYQGLSVMSPRNSKIFSQQ